MVTAALALVTVTVALDVARAGYRLWSSGPMIGAYVVTVLAGASFWAAVRDWPFPGRSGEPFQCRACA